MDTTVSEPTPARAVVIEAFATGEVDEHGTPWFVVETTVLADRAVPTRVRMRVAVPSLALGRLHPGAELDVEWLRDGDQFTPMLRFGDVPEQTLSSDSTTRSTAS